MSLVQKKDSNNTTDNSTTTDAANSTSSSSGGTGTGAVQTPVAPPVLLGALPPRTPSRQGSRQDKES